MSPDPTTVKIDEATKYILRTVHPTHYDKKSEFAHEVNRLLWSVKFYTPRFEVGWDTHRTPTHLVSSSHSNRHGRTPGIAPGTLTRKPPIFLRPISIRKTDLGGNFYPDAGYGFFFSLDTPCKHFKANGPWEFSSFGKIYPNSAKGKIKILPISIRIWVRNLRAFSGVLSWLSFFLGNFP